MSTPIEDRVAALETVAANQQKRITALESALAGAGQRFTGLDAKYADAVAKFADAARLVARLRVVLRVLWKSTAAQRAQFLSGLPLDERLQMGVDLEEVNNLEDIGRRPDPSSWKGHDDGDASA